MTVHEGEARLCGVGWDREGSATVQQRHICVKWGGTVWQAVCNKIRRQSDVDVRLSDVDVKAKTSTWNYSMASRL